MIQLQTPRSEPAPATAVELPQLSFTHAGQSRLLNKHPTVQTALRSGQITFADALKRNWYLRLDIHGQDRWFSCRTNKDQDAVRAAKDILNGRIQQPGQFSEFLAARARKAGQRVPLAKLLSAYRSSPSEASAHTRQGNINALGFIVASDKFVRDLQPDAVRDYFTRVNAAALGGARPAKGRVVAPQRK